MGQSAFLELKLFLEAFKHEEVIFFGGSFNPWHEGHRECLKLCPFPEKVVVIPDHNPQKIKHEFSTSEKFLEKLQNESKNLCFGIFTGFMQMENKNPTYYWIKFLQQEKPQLKLSLLLGADSFMGLKTWVEADNLLSLLTHLYVVPRLIDLEKVREAKLSFEKINPQLKITLLATHEYEHISSTNLRLK